MTDFDDVDQRLEELESRIRQASEDCLNRTVIRLAREGRRLARQEHRVIPYLSFSFHYINSADDVLAMSEGCEVAVEMIALLEDEDLARQFQPDLPMDEYEHTKWWSTGYTYKKLATLTGHTQGYNSEGMHQCISDGMVVCRRTGNLRDTLHFREFAVEVYRAADDLDMALHFARGSLQLQNSDDSNRRVASADDVATLLALQGNLAAAVEMAQLGWQYCLEFHNPYLAKLNFLPLARELYCLAGRQDLLDQLPTIVTAGESTDLPGERVLRTPPENECPYFVFLRDQTLAVEAACRGDFELAIRLLQPWDRQLLEERCLTRWLGVRCRLVAACRLAGRMDQAQALAKSCEEAARKAHDWLTLRRLERLLDESIPATPLALVGEADCGPFATRSTAAAVNVTSDISGNENDTPGNAPAAETGDAAPDPATPLRPLIESYYTRLQQENLDPAEVPAIADEVLAIEPASIAHPEDAGRLLHLIRFVADARHAFQIANWAQSISARFPTDATVLSLHAMLGARLRDFPDFPDDELDRLMATEQIESLFRQSMDLDANSATNFARAGLYYLNQSNFGDAERCLARGFRLDRTSGVLATRLAEVYSATDRPRDALAVLDMALREGCVDPDVMWQAALRANHLEQYEAALVYLDRYESVLPGEPWTNHYRAYSLLELNRPEEALAALDCEADRNPSAGYATSLQRASALGQLNRHDEFRQQLAEVLGTPMTSVAQISKNGLQRLFHRLWFSATSLPKEDPLRRLLEDHLVSTCLATNGFFDSLRAGSDAAVAAPGEDSTAPDKDSTTVVQFYRIIVRQPLDEDWRHSRGCLAGEEEWGSYDIAWGILAVDETSARDTVLQWQRRCYPLPAGILSLETGEETYNDRPGIVWQGQREGTQTPPG